MDRGRMNGARQNSMMTKQPISDCFKQWMTEWEPQWWKKEGIQVKKARPHVFMILNIVISSRMPYLYGTSFPSSSSNRYLWTSGMWVTQWLGHRLQIVQSKHFLAAEISCHTEFPFWTFVIAVRYFLNASHSFWPSSQLPVAPSLWI